MNTKLFAAAALLCVAAGAQTTSSSNESAPLPSLRRFSAGLTLSVQALKTIKPNTSSVITTSPAVDSLYTTASDSGRVGYGVNAQIGLTEHFTVNGSLILRKIAYTMTSSIIEGVDIAGTSADERRFTNRNEDTRARFYDLPLTLRYYQEASAKHRLRWFFEGGPAYRRVTKIKTSITTQVNTADPVCCNTTPANPSKRTLLGFVAGIGLHAVDPLGIRVIPQVRYTRWMGESFNNFSTITQRNQIEGVISISF
jgi:hypothetical protein